MALIGYGVYRFKMASCYLENIKDDPKMSNAKIITAFHHNGCPSCIKKTGPDWFK
jgi:hypothetical protein